MKKDRTKNGQTPKQNKWKDPFFVAKALLRDHRGILKTEFSRIVREGEKQ